MPGFFCDFCRLKLFDIDPAAFMLAVIKILPLLKHLKIGFHLGVGVNPLDTRSLQGLIERFHHDGVDPPALELWADRTQVHIHPVKTLHGAQ